MSRDFTEKLILIGKVVRPHGLEGVLRIKSYGQSEESFSNAGSVFLKLTQEDPVEFEILSVKPHKNLFLMKLKGIDSIEQAEQYRNAEVSLKERNLRKKDPDEYFWYELKGLEVFLDTGESVGKITDIIPTGSNDIFVVKSGNGEVLIPALHGVVQSVDPEKGKMTVSAIKGLLDLNEV